MLVARRAKRSWMFAMVLALCLAGYGETTRSDPVDARPNVIPSLPECSPSAKARPARAANKRMIGKRVELRGVLTFARTYRSNCAIHASWRIVDAPANPLQERVTALLLNFETTWPESEPYPARPYINVIATGVLRVMPPSSRYTTTFSWKGRRSVAKKPIRVSPGKPIDTQKTQDGTTWSAARFFEHTMRPGRITLRPGRPELPLDQDSHLGASTAQRPSAPWLAPLAHQNHPIDTSHLVRNLP
jgi:hypothetical protein